MQRIIYSIILTLAALCAVSKCHAAQASLLTCAPGAEVYELCGHTALRITTDSTDVVVNYGLFDFNSPNFLYRFVKGQTDYMVGALPAERFLKAYAVDGRKITEQVLNLDSIQVSRLIQLLSENLRPENRTYRYNYVLDNCATRPLRIIELSIGKPLIFPDIHLPGTQNATFRSEMKRFHKNYPWYQFGIDLALGSGIDRPITEREKAFAPVTLSELAPLIYFTDSNNIPQPLVYETKTTTPISSVNVTASPTPWILSPMAVACFVLLLSLCISIHDIKRRQISRIFDTILFSIFGIAGSLLTFLVFISTHEATSPNWLLAWLNPICFAGALLPWLKKCKTALNLYHFTNFVVLLLLLGLWRMTGQSANIAFFPLIAADIIRSATYIYIKCVNDKTA